VSDISIEYIPASEDKNVDLSYHPKSKISNNIEEQDLTMIDNSASLDYFYHMIQIYQISVEIEGVSNIWIDEKQQ